jgi:outer membrane receptor protein involved in Fe transport
MNTKHFILVLLLISFITPLSGQTNQMQGGRIEGCVRDSADKAIRDASIFFLKSDSLIAIASADSKGCFSLKIDTGNYVVHVTHLGYEEYSGDITLTPAGFRLPAIVLKEAAVELDAVTVSQQTFSAESNKSLFKIPANVKSSSTDVYQMLATVPALNVNIAERQIELLGSDNSIITVNNIRRDGSYLLLLNPKDIDHVEIIRNPSSRYKNVQGIINIVAKAPATGQILNLYGRLEPSLEQGFAYGNYRYVGKKVSASLSLQNFFFDDANGEESIIRDVSVGNDMIHTEKKSDAVFLSYIDTEIGANIDYISSKTFASLTLGYNLTPMEKNSPYTGSVNSGSRGYNFDAFNKYKEENNNYRMNLYYQTDFNKKNSMSIDARYNIKSTESNTLYTENNDNGHFYENRQINSTDKQGLEAQINFQQHLSKVNLEEGYRIYLDNNVINNESNEGFSKTEHEEWRHYFYTDLLGDINKKLVYQAGIGFDMSRITLNNALSVHNELTPNAMLRYIMKDGQNISLSYSLTRKSPQSSALNPIPNYVDSSRIITGNPDLKPYYFNTFGLNYELNKNRLYFQAKLQYDFANNYITMYENLDGNGVYHISYVNVNNYSSVLSSLNVSYSIFNWWRIMAYGSMKYNMYKDDNMPSLNKNFWRPYVQITSNANYKRLSLYLRYFPRFRVATLTGFSRYAEESSLDASYRFNNSWTITGMMRYLTPSSSKRETIGDGFSETYYNNITARYFRFIFGIRYNFQKGKQQKSRQKKVKNYNDETYINVESY